LLPVLKHFKSKVNAKNNNINFCVNLPLIRDDNRTKNKHKLY
jgi:hypothetical protein